jgi:nucleoside-diphosphate-sugar epimerase
MKRVLLTGASGFIGHAAIAPRQRAGFQVVAVGRRAPDAEDVEFIGADLLDRTALSEAVAAAGASHLLHFAWFVTPGKFWGSEQNLAWAATTLDLLRFFREAGGARAVLAGTCAEYTWQPGGTLREHQTPEHPASLYGVAKHATRMVAEKFAITSGMSLAWGRIFWVYGPREAAGRLVSDAIVALLDGQRFATSAGLQRRDFLHVSDVAEGFVRLLDSDVEGPVNIASGHGETVRSILERIAQAAGRDLSLIDFGAFATRSDEPMLIEGAVDRLRSEVGAPPGRPIETGLRETVEWWRSRGKK